MANVKKSLQKTVDKEQLLADIEALKSAKTDKEVDDILKKYKTAIKKMDAQKAEEQAAKEAEQKAKKRKAAAKKAAATRKAKQKEEELKAKKRSEAAKKAAATRAAKKAEEDEQAKLAAQQQAEAEAAEKARLEEEARKAEEERIAREKAEAEAAEKARLEEEAKKAEEERLAKEKAEAEAAEKARLEEEAKKAEEERLAKEKAEAEAADEAKKAEPKKAPAKKAAKKVAEAAPQAAETIGKGYSGKYEVYQAGDGFAYTLKASNGQKLVESEIYKSRDGVLKAIEAIKKNVSDGDIKVFADKHGKHKFKLIAKNHRILAISANYDTDDRAIKASESFKKFALQAVIVDVEVKDSDIMTDIVIQKTEDKTGGKYIVEEFNGEYSWDLKATNGQILCQKDGYTSKKNCLDAIENFKTYVETGSFKLTTDKRDHSYYKLYTPSGRVFVAGEAYSSKAQAESAANSVVSFYKLAEIVEDKPVITEEKPAKKSTKKEA